MRDAPQPLTVAIAGVYLVKIVWLVRVSEADLFAKLKFDGKFSEASALYMMPALMNSKIATMHPLNLQLASFHTMKLIMNNSLPGTEKSSILVLLVLRD